jgi:hypothetical protein
MLFVASSLRFLIRGLEKKLFTFFQNFMVGPLSGAAAGLQGIERGRYQSRLIGLGCIYPEENFGPIRFHGLRIMRGLLSMED